MSTVKRIAVIDCQGSGISGDMILAALIDMGADPEKINQSIQHLETSLIGCKSVELVVRDVTRKGFRAKKVDVKTEEDVAYRTGRQLKDALADSLDALRLPIECARLAASALDTLIDAEAKLHGQSPEEVHLHEAGSVDTLAEMVGVAIAFENLGLLKDTIFYSTPVAVGGGRFTFSHGEVSTPAPATLEILRKRNFAMVGGPVDSELATPTGVSLLTNLAHVTSTYYPAMKPTMIGYGAGASDYVEAPNLLRIVVGKQFDEFASDVIHVLETNLDDVSGEVIGYAFERLLEEGAKDVSIIPMFTKKNRPSQILRVVSDIKDVDNLVRVLVEETGTLGVRDYSCGRHILLREIASIDLRIDDSSEPVRVKIARDRDGKIVQVKPEYSDIERLARRTGKPFRILNEMAARKARSELEKGS
jgi:hypothetical protein